MYTISKGFQFSAGHHLEGLPEEHPCTRPHGHNYEVIVILESDLLNENGFVLDYRELKSVKDYLDQVFDHRYLNDFLPFNPTAENIAKHLYYQFNALIGSHLLKAVKVKETPKTEATYEPDHD